MKNFDLNSWGTSSPHSNVPATCQLIRLMGALILLVGTGLAAAAQTIETPALETHRFEVSEQPLVNAHAHNDYNHERPLLDALSHGFTSVEADVFLRNGELLVGHSLFELNRARSLQKLYLDPLQKIADGNKGFIYSDSTELTLLIDIKQDGKRAFEKLGEVLSNYPELISTYQNQIYQKRAVRVVISGDRPLAEIRNDKNGLAGIDGRVGDLGSDENGHLMPLISENWGTHFQWRGNGEFPAKEKERLQAMVEQAHAAGRRVRFWATPESPEIWQALVDAKVDLIGTDHLKQLADFLRPAKVPGADQ